MRFYFFLIIEFYFLILAVIAQVLNAAAKLVSAIGVTTKEEKSEIEAKINKCSI